MGRTQLKWEERTNKGDMGNSNFEHPNRSSAALAFRKKKPNNVVLKEEVFTTPKCTLQIHHPWIVNRQALEATSSIRKGFCVLFAKTTNAGRICCCVALPTQRKTLLEHYYFAELRWVKFYFPFASFDKSCCRKKKACDLQVLQWNPCNARIPNTGRTISTKLTSSLCTRCSISLYWSNLQIPPPPHRRSENHQHEIQLPHGWLLLLTTF